MFPAWDVIPATLLPALVLVALAVFMPFTGRAEARRRAAWARFDALCRIRGLPSHERDALAAWARVSCPESPHLVLSRRQDFERFVRSEVQRLGPPGLVGEVRRAFLHRLRDLRTRLGFVPGPGRPLSTHDLRPGERLELRFDDGRRLDAVVTEVDEEGIGLRPLPGAREARLAPAWVSFQREGEGAFRFRAAPLPGRLALAHGEFLIHEERRREPRVVLSMAPFWISVERLPDGAAPEDPEGVEVEILDLSVGGLALLADRDVRRGSEVMIDLPLGAGIMVRGLRARVLGRGYREGGGRLPHFLHCQFLDPPEPARKVLDAFVTSRVEESEA